MYRRNMDRKRQLRTKMTMWRLHDNERQRLKQTESEGQRWMESHWRRKEKENERQLDIDG